MSFDSAADFDCSIKVNLSKKSKHMAIFDDLGLIVTQIMKW